MGAKELRLAFAMGGGVSLGTFAGSALTQAIKLAVLRSGYERVVIDAFSGASAGAMALGIMLRSLVHPSCGGKSRSQREAAAVSALAAEFGDEFTSLSTDPGAAAGRRRRLLIDAQIVQDVQAEIWGERITLDGMLGRGPGGQRDLTHTASILDRGEVDRIAGEYIAFRGDAADEHGRAILSERSPLLGERVLMACSLSNLTPLVSDARRDLSRYEAGFVGLGDGGRSLVHAELRVFDLVFRDGGDAEYQDGEVHPSRWCRYRAGDESRGLVGDLREQKAWQKIAATTIACGAFPFAFEPVVLARSQYEFGRSLWPRELPWVEGPPAPGDKIPKFRFSYIDGGVFNNEPIREAFRLAAFLDARRPGDFDRRVIFVDPFVDPGEPSLEVGVHREFSLQKPNLLRSLDGWDLFRRASLDRLAPHIGAVAGAIANEARVVEADKVYATRRRFEDRDALRAHLAHVRLPRLDPADPATAQRRTAVLVGLREFCERQLKTDAAESIMPAGRLTLAGELARVLAEEGDALGTPDRAVGDFLSAPSPGSLPDADVWHRLLLAVALDLTLDLAGKSDRGHLIAIGPFANLPTEQNPAPPRPIKLWGGEVHGFAGFASLANRPHELAAGRYCAQLFLQTCGLIPESPLGPVPALSPERQQQFRADVARGMAALADRVNDMLRQSNLVDVLPVLNQGVLAAIGAVLKDKVRAMADLAPPTRKCELRILVPDGGYELDGRGLGDQDLKPVRLPGLDRFALITFAEYEPESGRWSGPHVDEAAQTVTIDRNLRLRSFCSLRLPDPPLLAEVRRHPCARLTAEIQPSDNGSFGIPDRWRLDSSEPEALDELLFGKTR